MAFPMVFLEKRLAIQTLKCSPWASYLPEKLKCRQEDGDMEQFEIPMVKKCCSIGSLSTASPCSSCGLVLRQASDDSINSVSDSSPVFEVPRDEHADQDQQPVDHSTNILSESVCGRVWELSQTPDGSRLVQQAIVSSASDDCMALVSELHGKVWQAIQCPHANHVIAVLVRELPNKAFQFVVDEVLSVNAANVAKHRYGCRTIKCLLEFGCDVQIGNLVQPLFNDFLGVAANPYGTFVVQHMLMHVEAACDRVRLMDLIVQTAPELAKDSHGSAIIFALLSEEGGSSEEGIRVCQSIVSVPGSLAQMSCLRNGHRATRQLLADLGDFSEHLDAVRRELVAHTATLQSSRYGRVVLKFLLSDYRITTA